MLFACLRRWTCVLVWHSALWQPTPARQIDRSGRSRHGQQQIAERFLTVLERNPRRGTALDKIYGFHVDNGTLDELVGRYADRTQKDPNDGTAWLIRGLIEAHHGATPPPSSGGTPPRCEQTTRWPPIISASR